jgi:hypothetical protein
MQCAGVCSLNGFGPFRARCSGSILLFQRRTSLLGERECLVCRFRPQARFGQAAPACRPPLGSDADQLGWYPGGQMAWRPTLVLRPWRLVLVINEANALGNGQHLAIIAFRRCQARTTGGDRVGLSSMPMGKGPLLAGWSVPPPGIPDPLGPVPSGRLRWHFIRRFSSRSRSL